MEGEFAAAGPQTAADLMAQMAFGECWTCQAARLYAANEFMIALDKLRVYERAYGEGSAPQSLRDAIADAGAALTRAGLRELPVRPAWRATRAFPQVAGREGESQ